MNARLRRKLRKDWPLASVGFGARQSPTLKQRLGRDIVDHLPISKFLFDQLRIEVRAYFLKWQYRLIPLRRRNVAKLRKKRGIFANIGCGPQILSGYINLDLFQAMTTFSLGTADG